MRKFKNWFLKICISIFSLVSIGNAEVDICYSDKSTSGVCTPFMGFFCSHNTTLKSISSSELSDVVISKGYMGFDMTWGETLKIDGNTKTTVSDNPDNGSSEFRAESVSTFGGSVDTAFGNMGGGFGLGGYGYTLGSMTTNEQHIISDGYTMSMGFTLPTSSLIATYVKNGVTYSEPIPPCSGTYITISDANITEGDSGTKIMSFTVNLVNPPSGAGSNDKTDLSFTTVGATATGATATGGTDYVSLTNFTANNLVVSNFPYTVNVTINGDTTIEDNETFFIDMTIGENDLNAVLTDSRGVGTIIDDDNGGGSSGSEGQTGEFNVVHTAYYNNGLGTNIPTQIASRVDDFKVLAYAVGTTTLKNVSAPVSIQLVDGNSAALCQDMTPLTDLITTVFDNSSFAPFTADIIAGNYGFDDPADTTKDEEFYGKAVKNAYFRISYEATDGNGSLIDTNVIDSGPHAGNIEIVNFTELAQGLEGYNDDLPPNEQNKCVEPFVRGNITYTTMPQSCGNAANTNGLTLEELSICMECVYGMNTRTFCSSDNFAIRPDTYTNPPTITPTTVLPSGKLIAGEDFNLTVVARGYGDVNLTGYDGNATVSPLTPLVACEVDDGNLTNDINTSASPLIFNGVDTNVSNNIKFGDIGLFDINITDSTWSAVDSVKSPAECIVGSNTNVADVNGKIGCDVSITFQKIVIPDHFDVNGTLSNRSSGFTYLHNNEANASKDGNISAIFDLNVYAKSAVNTPTLNYSSDCYAQDGNSTINFVFTPAISPDGNLTTLLGYDDNNHSATGFSGIITDNNASIAVPLHSAERFNDGNGTLRYRLNFDRNVTMAVNPFMMSIPQVDVEDNDTVTGSTIQPIDNNATFIYGRTHASKQRYSCTTSPCVGSANIYFESFCFGAGCDKNLLPNNLASKRIDDVRWFWNENHTANDGNVTIVVQKGGANTNADTVRATDNPVVNLSVSVTDPTYHGTSYPYKTTMENGASPWLIYNESDPTATRNEFQVEFTSQTDWSGVHDTNNTSKAKSTPWTNKRLDW